MRFAKIITLTLCLQLFAQLVACTTRDSARQRMEAAERARAGGGGSTGQATGAGGGGGGGGSGSGSSNQVVAASGLEPVEYLKRFGYLTEQPGDLENSVKVVEKAVGKFQSYMGVYQSNIIDSITTKHMKRARCGNKDILPDDTEPPATGEEEEDADENLKDDRPKSKEEPEARWQTKTGQLTYKIVNYPSRLRNRKADVDETFKQAFATWEAVVPIKFERRTSGDVNIDIHFIAGEHDCPAGPLHRAGSDTPILAHAFGPPKPAAGPRLAEAVVAPADSLDGDMHFNDQVLWIVDSGSSKVTRSGQSLLAAAIHQIGHSLGLKHNRLLGSKMFPIEAGQVKLNESDKISIQQIYSPKRRLDSFYTIENRQLSDKEHNLREIKNIGSLNDCSEYATKNRFNLTVWDRNKHTCAVKLTLWDTAEWSLYSTAGKLVSSFDVQGYDQDTTELESDVSQWVASRQCDIIQKLVEWPIKDHTSYKCKVFEEDDCCVMLFRIGRDRSQPDLLGDKQGQQS